MHAFFYLHNPYFYIFSAKAGQDSSTFFSACAEKMQFYCSSRTYYAIPYCTIFSILTLHYALRRVHYITYIYSKLQSYKFRLSAMRQYRSKIIYRPTLQVQ